MAGARIFGKAKERNPRPGEVPHTPKIRKMFDSDRHKSLDEVLGGKDPRYNKLGSVDKPHIEMLIKDDEAPKIYVEGKPVAVHDIRYHWHTAESDSDHVYDIEITYYIGTEEHTEIIQDIFSKTEKSMTMDDVADLIRKGIVR